MGAYSFWLILNFFNPESVVSNNNNNVKFRYFKKILNLNTSLSFKATNVTFWLNKSSVLCRHCCK